MDMKKDIEALLLKAHELEKNDVALVGNEWLTIQSILGGIWSGEVTLYFQNGSECSVTPYTEFEIREGCRA